ncbi:MAG TPA: isochorismate synthase [Opitutaceae bacterium]|nr:isochorismate synthase [Opitutaceae bacterium]
MTILPLNPTENASPAALGDFFAQCRQAARAAGAPKLVSISVTVDALDSLAVLESIYESKELHFYAENPRLDTAIAGADAVLAYEAAGEGRFRDVQDFIDRTLQHTIAVGAVDAPMGGPHFFTSFAFHDHVEEGEPFPAARVFVPRWQVSRTGEITTAVANLIVNPDTDLAVLTERVWNAHRRFSAFDYSASSGSLPKVSAEMGGQKATVDPTGGGLRVHDVGDYRAAVLRGLQLIESGDVRKIVLARAKDVVMPRALHPLRVLNDLRQRFPDCYAFSVGDGHGRSFIGASPERLVRVSKGQLQTEALAGSTRRGASASEDAALSGALLRSEKDLREHRLVLESIARRLRTLGVDVDTSTKPGLRRLANVQHLSTPIHASLPADVRLLDLLSVLHPTPAVGGTPREQAVPRIREIEGVARGLYAGALGWINARGGGEFFVGIRSALIDGDHARVYAGAGIVAGSTPEQEDAETELKARALLEALARSETVG